MLKHKDLLVNGKNTSYYSWTKILSYTYLVFTKTQCKLEMEWNLSGPVFRVLYLPVKTIPKYKLSSGGSSNVEACME